MILFESLTYNLVPVLSWPHFLHAEAKYQDAVEGLKPDKNIHGFWFDIQQVTGTTLSAKVRWSNSFIVAVFFLMVTDLSGKDPDQHECETDGSL